MKILITGGGGMLARELEHTLRNEKNDFVCLNREQLNITNPEKLSKAVDEHKPGVIINCAAYTKVDMAEIQKDTAFLVNAVGPYNLAAVCKKYGILLVHVSTDFIFSGLKKQPYHSFDAGDPINYYGLSKLYGEQFIINSRCDYLIVRTSWLYGPHGENFVMKMLSLSEERAGIDVVNDQFGAPTYTHTLVRYLVMLLKKNARGVFHISDRAGNGISWYTFAKKIMEVFERPTVINPVTSEAFARPARRPAYSVLDLEATEYIQGEKLPYWEISLGEFRKRLKL
jgi:dTDP-4-dehydrorhamnose reductase